MGFFDKIKQGLKKTKEGVFGQIDGLLKSFRKVDEELFEELEELLIMADCGAKTASEICDRLRTRVKKSSIKEAAEVRDALEEVIGDMLEGEHSLKLTTKPSVLLIIGVNGVGKTTTIGKICARMNAEGKKCVIAAADTFRAAAIDQLNIWAERSNCDIVKHSEGADPAAVVFDAANAAKARGADVLVIDTAGRLHNKKYLMDELAKISRVLDRELPDCDREVLLVLDATTGQNAVNQARAFRDTAGLTGIVLTKLDGTARGGVVISIKEELGVPVKFIGVGEQIDDLQVFEPRPFARALFDDGSIEESDAAVEEPVDEVVEETATVIEEPVEEVVEETAAAVEEPVEEVVEETAAAVEEPVEEVVEETAAVIEEPVEEVVEETATVIEEPVEEAVEDTADEEAGDDDRDYGDDVDWQSGDDDDDDDNDEEDDDEQEEKPRSKGVFAWLRNLSKKK